MFDFGHLTWPRTHFTFLYLRPNKDRLCQNVKTKDACRLTMFFAIGIRTETEQSDGEKRRIVEEEYFVTCYGHGRRKAGREQRQK